MSVCVCVCVCVVCAPLFPLLRLVVSANDLCKAGKIDGKASSWLPYQKKRRHTERVAK
ncbi:hypothetical protein LX36DRAFT_650693 [Colletotrichum falcatum]|nr:hypothetical protein LX36DRAFT_650693 [Colletotrichum falcatum]